MTDIEIQREPLPDITTGRGPIPAGSCWHVRCSSIHLMFGPCPDGYTEPTQRLDGHTGQAARPAEATSEPIRVTVPIVAAEPATTPPSPAEEPGRMAGRRHSYSSLQTLQVCERKYAYRYVEELTSDKPEALPLIRGHAWHAVMEAYGLALGARLDSLLVRPRKIRVLDGLELDVDWGTPRRPAISVPGEPGDLIELTPHTVIGHVARWESRQDGERREGMGSEYGGPLSDRLAELWERYLRHWNATDNTTQMPLLVETSWGRNAPNGIRLVGRVDAVLWDADRRVVIVRDYKLHQSWPSEADAVVDLMDSQLHLQAWGIAPYLRELTKNHDGGPKNPGAVEFDRTRFKKPTTPQLTQAGKLSASCTDFDGWTYQRWCDTHPMPELTPTSIKKGVDPTTLVHVFDPEVFDKAESDRKAWFRRSMKPLSMRAVSAHVLASQKQARRAATVQTETAGISPSKACSWCEYLSVCRAEMIGGKPDPFVPQDWGLKIRSRRG